MLQSTTYSLQCQYHISPNSYAAVVVLFALYDASHAMRISQPVPTMAHIVHAQDDSMYVPNLTAAYCAGECPAFGVVHAVV